MGRKRIEQQLVIEMKQLRKEGKNRFEIAKLLNISPRTVATYIGTDSPQEH